MIRSNLITGRGRYARAIRELQQEVGRIRPGFVPGARVSHTTRGVVIEPDGAADTGQSPRKISSNVPRWG